MKEQKSDKPDRCAVISCIHNEAYNNDKPELRRCKHGHEPNFTKHGPCPKEYETGVKSEL